VPNTKLQREHGENEKGNQWSLRSVWWGQLTRDQLSMDEGINRECLVTLHWRNNLWLFTINLVRVYKQIT